MNETRETQFFRCGMELLQWVEARRDRRDGLYVMLPELASIALAMLELASHRGPDYGDNCIKEVTW